MALSPLSHATNLSRIHSSDDADVFVASEPGPPGASSEAFVFAPIDLEQHGAWCASVRAETFAVSFDSDVMFWEEAGQGGTFYLEALRERMQWNPGSCVLLWKGEQWVGMLELKPYGADPSVGYVNTFYLVPESRGLGWTRWLELYVQHFFASLGITTIRLTVSPANLRAVSYYQQAGWEHIGELSVSAGWLRRYNSAVPGASDFLATALDETGQSPSCPEGESVYLMEKRYEG